jgi:hypothetical protein
MTSPPVLIAQLCWSPALMDLNLIVVLIGRGTFDPGTGPDCSQFALPQQ